LLHKNHGMMEQPPKPDFPRPPDPIDTPPPDIKPVPPPDIPPIPVPERGPLAERIWHSRLFGAPDEAGRFRRFCVAA
jgi:hypothetical protein